MSEAYLTGALLAVVGGFLDAYTYACRGSVFATAETGNMILMGMNFAAGRWRQALYYVAPILSFFVGIIVAEMTKSRFRESDAIHWRQIVIALEIVVLAAVAFLPLGAADTLANVCVSFVSSLQVESFRKVNGNSFMTTMCTGNFRSATEHLYHYRKTKDRAFLRDSLQYYGIIAIFIAGAVTGFSLAGIFAEKAVLFACLGLLAVFLLLFRRETAPAGG